jgi:hypothetical protein
MQPGHVADWSLLIHYLGGSGDTVPLTWSELDRVVAGFQLRLPGIGHGVAEMSMQSGRISRRLEQPLWTCCTGADLARESPGTTHVAILFDEPCAVPPKALVATADLRPGLIALKRGDWKCDRP